MQVLSLFVVACCTFLASAANYALNVVAAHRLTSDSFGAFGAILGTVAILSTLGLAAQAVIARDYFHSSDSNHTPQFSGKFARQLLLGSTAICLVMVLPISIWLQLDLLASFLFLISIPISLIPAFAVGKLQGRRSFLRLGIVILMVGASRALFGVVAVLFDSSLTSLAIGMLIGTMVGAGLSYALGLNGASWTGLQRNGGVWNYLIVLQALALMFALSNIDVVLARILLSSSESGVYAVGSLMAKIAFFLPSPLLIVLYPSMGNRSSRRSVYLAAAGTLLCGLVLLTFVRLRPSLTAGLLAGADLSSVSSILWLFVVSGTCLAIVQVALYAQLAHQNSGVIKLMWFGLVSLVLCILITSKSGPSAIVLSVIVVSSVLAVVGLILDRSLLDPAEIPVEIAN